MIFFQDEAATDTSEMSFRTSEGAFTYIEVAVDSGSEWFFASYGDIFTADTIANGDFQEFTPSMFSAGAIGYNPGFDDFYLGLNTGTSDFPGSPYHRNIFGWVHLQNINGEIVMLDNAMSYGAEGIVVGTLSEVPVPPALPLFLSALTLVFGSRIRKQK